MPTTTVRNNFQDCLDILTQGEEGSQLLDRLTSQKFSSVEEAKAGAKLLAHFKLHLGDWNGRDMTLVIKQIHKNIREGMYR